MATDESSQNSPSKRVVIIKNGPYVIEGGVPLVSKTQVVSEHGEPLTWRKDGEISVGPGEYRLCRCGQSSNKPFCDDTHLKIDFDGTEDADTAMSDTRKSTIPRGTGIIVEKDSSLCMLSGFCEFSDVGLGRLMTATQDTKMRALVMAMIERCPSGALTYRIEADGPEIEPDLPPQIAVTTEITSHGPIAGPLWVTGNISIERSDGQPFRTRNRVTLCNCGHSCNKPLCDGTHRDMAQREAWRRRRAGL
ncbi:MAG TPA: CDGSH iron-sulfur domain-containing protein [Anaerolineales bacterium]|nr:CDGSH iron-sulfur domain-containing protein [Anaerolineales bacterium]